MENTFIFENIIMSTYNHIVIFHIKRERREDTKRTSKWRNYVHSNTRRTKKKAHFSIIYSDKQSKMGFQRTTPSDPCLSYLPSLIVPNERENGKFSQYPQTTLLMISHPTIPRHTLTSAKILKKFGLVDRCSFSAATYQSAFFNPLAWSWIWASTWCGAKNRFFFSPRNANKNSNPRRNREVRYLPRSIKIFDS